MPIRSLGLLAIAFVLFFALQLLAVLVPFQPLDPAWQWRLSNGLINGAPLPLLALALQLIASALDPGDALLKRRQRLFRQLAVPAAVGFLLLLPLQLSAGLHLQSSISKAQINRITGAERRLAALRELTARASSTAELTAGLQKLSSPMLGPADLAQPLPLIKARLNAVFDKAQIQINGARATQRPATDSAAATLPALLRNSLACLLLAGTYAAFAVRPGCKMTLLEEGRERLVRLRRPRPDRSLGTSEADYIRRLSGEKD